MAIARSVKVCGIAMPQEILRDSIMDILVDSSSETASLQIWKEHRVVLSRPRRASSGLFRKRRKFSRPLLITRCQLDQDFIGVAHVD